MEPKPLERVLRILHGEYEFDPVVSEAQKQGYVDNALKCVQQHCMLYDDCNEVFFWEEFWEDEEKPFGRISGTLNKIDKLSIEDVFLYWNGARLQPGLTDVLAKLRLEKDYGITHHWVMWGNFVTWLTTTEAIAAIDNEEAYLKLLRRGVPVKHIDYVLETLIDTDEKGSVRQHQQTLKERKKKKNVGHTK